MFKGKNMKVKENSVIKLIAYAPLFVIPLFILVIVISVAKENKLNFEKTKNRVELDLINSKNYAIKAKIDSIVDLVNYQNDILEKKLSNRVKDRVNTAYKVAIELYEQNKSLKTKKEVKDLIINALRPMSWNNEDSYIWISDYAGELQLGPEYLNHLEGTSILNFKDAFGRYIIKEEINVVKNKTEGFIWDTFIKPQDPLRRYYEQIVFVKALGVYNWYLGSAEYLDTATKVNETEILNAIKKVSDNKNEYIFVVKGDGTLLLNYGEPELVGKNVLKTKKYSINSSFEKIFKKLELEDELFLDYIWLNPLTKLVEKKYSYFKKIKGTSWIVGSGFYKSDVKVIATEQTTRLYKEYNLRINQIMYIGLILIIISLIGSLLISRYIKNKFFTYKKKLMENGLELKKTNEKLNDIIDNINDLIWEADISGIYTYISPQSKRILGLLPCDILGKSPFVFMYKKEAFRVLSLLASILENEKPILQLRSIYIHQNGTKVYLETSANPIFDMKNNLIGYRGTHRDITERIKYDEIIQNTNKELKELNDNLQLKVNVEVAKNKENEEQLSSQAKLAALGDMIGNIAHQWRQPLSIISTIASGVKLKHQFNNLEPNEVPIKMNEIVDKTKHLSQTIDTFRNFLKEKKIFREIVLQNCVNESLKIIGTTLTDNYIQLEKNYEEKTPIFITSISNEINQVIINILSNAKDAIIDKDIHNAWVKISIMKNQKSAIITIEDNAGGIPLDIISKVFEPYFTTKHKKQGTGLGLHMSYRIIVDSLNGNLYVKNSDFGAKFFIELPLTN